MTSEVLSALLRINAAGAAAILAVLVLRLPVRRLFGPEVAYRLWAIPPLAAAAMLLPPRVMHEALPADTVPTVIHGAGPMLALWAAGMALVALLLWRAQAQFLRAARAGLAGPSVVGVIAPRILMPPDDGRYTPEERELIRAHEREHVARMDPRAGAFSAACQCLVWFNPLVHVAAHLVRLDQELACDAAVLRRRPRQRALYAKTLLKTQLAAAPLPFGCYWPARGRHPLEVRVALLKRGPSRSELAGTGIVVAAAMAASLMAWSSKPPIPPHMPYPGQWTPEERSTMSVMLLTWPAREKR